MKKVMYCSNMLHKTYFILLITLFKMLNDNLIRIKFNISYCWVSSVHSLIILSVDSPLHFSQLSNGDGVGIKDHALDDSRTFRFEKSKIFRL
jgi:hypothetical protein